MADFTIAAVIITTADWLASATIAPLIAETATVSGANGSTEVAEARLSIGAVAVFVALWCWRSDAADFGSWTRHHSLGTRASRSLVGYGAEGVGSAWIFIAGIGALVVATRFTGAAVGVLMASVDTSVVEANVSQEAVVVHSTRQQAVSLEAALVQGTLLIVGAGWEAHCVSTGVTGTAICIYTASDGH